MKILILAIHYEVTGARYIADAFARLGHEVKHWGYQARLKNAWGVDVPEKYIWKPDELNSDWKPDLIIVADTEMESLKGINLYPNVPVVGWSNDNHVRTIRSLSITHYFLAHFHGAAQPVIEADETWLPCATDEIAFPPSPYSWEEKEYDFCCIGVMYPDRARRIQLLKDAGYKVFSATGLVYEEYAKAYQNSRVALCSSVNHDLAQRFFEGAGMGCLVFTDVVDDLVDEKTGNALGVSGYVSYNNDAELLSFANSFLRDPAEIPIGKAAALRLQLIVLAKHTWTQRCQVVVDWYQANYGGKVITLDLHPDIVEDIERNRKPYLNLGCGRTHFPSAPPAGHEIVDPSVYQYPLWLNVDKVDGVGADKVFDLFTYPWPLEDNSFDGAVLAHILEHVGHEIKIHPLARNMNSSYMPMNMTWGRISEIVATLETLQDGWYAFMSELYRVLTPGALVHIVSPYGFSDGGITDPSHTRYLTMNTFTHSMTPDISDGGTFKYNNGGINFVIEGNPQYRLTPYAEILKKLYENNRAKVDYDFLMGTHLNVCYDFYVKLKAVK